MKVWIDKNGGTHYHKEGCKMIQPPNLKTLLTQITFHYEPIEHKVRRLGMPYHKEYGRIMVDKKLYYPCPICFRDSSRIEQIGLDGKARVDIINYYNPPIKNKKD